MLDTAGVLTSCLCHCQELSGSHHTAATDTFRLNLIGSRRSGGTKMYQKFNELPNKAELNKSIKLHSKILGPCGKYTSRPLWFNSAIVQLKIN